MTSQRFSNSRMPSCQRPQAASWIRHGSIVGRSHSLRARSIFPLHVRWRSPLRQRHIEFGDRPSATARKWAGTQHLLHTRRHRTERRRSQLHRGVRSPRGRGAGRCGQSPANDSWDGWGRGNSRCMRAKAAAGSRQGHRGSIGFVAGLLVLRGRGGPSLSPFSSPHVSVTEDPLARDVLVAILDPPLGQPRRHLPRGPVEHRLGGGAAGHHRQPKQGERV